VVIVDDQALVRTGFRLILTAGGLDVGLAAWLALPPSINAAVKRPASSLVPLSVAF
jgi:DNA-binding NarL/FixJ family response regulator